MHLMTIIHDTELLLSLHRKKFTYPLSFKQIRCTGTSLVSAAKVSSKGLTKSPSISKIEIYIQQNYFAVVGTLTVGVLLNNSFLD